MLSLTRKMAGALAGAKFIDLFAGIGGFRLALGSYGAACVMSSEIDQACRLTYEQNHGETPLGDVTMISAADVPDHDFLCAGFPCQPFSISGKQMGFEDDRGLLFHEICRIAKARKPGVMILENVRNLASHDGGRTMSVILGLLSDLGYEVSSQVVNAGLFGVPQARERVFLVCSRRGKKLAFPKPTMGQVFLRDVLEPSHDPSLEIDLSRLRHEVDDSDPRPALEPIRIGSVNLGRQGERIYHPNGHAITLSSGGGGVGAKTGMYKVGGIVRRLTPRECARLTGLPDSFRLHPSTNQCYRQFGNSLVVDVVQHLVGAIVDQGLA